MRDPNGKNRLTRIKTGKWERQWSMTKAGLTAGSQAASKMLGSAFLSKDNRTLRNKKILSEQSQYLVDEIGKLKGSVVKVGQIMALYGEHILPEEVTVALRTLEEQTTALEWSAIEKVIQKELGDKINDFTIDHNPIGAASLAQVHCAVHKPSGKKVCLKVQYPGVAESIDSDLGNVVRLLKYSRMVNVGVRFDEWINEVRDLLHYEVDYTREAKMTQKFSQFLRDDVIFSVPTIYEKYSTPRLLVSSFEAGVAVNDASILDIPQAIRNQLGEAFLALFIDEVFVWGVIQTDPNFGNYRIQSNQDGDDKLENYKIALLDFGAVLQYPDSFLNPVKDIVLGAYQDDYQRMKNGAIALGMMQVEYPEEVHRDFADLCKLLVEPFTYKNTLTEAENEKVPKDAVNAEGEYRWGHSRLPKRAAKHAAKSALSKYFTVPPKEFAFLSRKLLGVYSFIAALDAEFDPHGILDNYID